MYIFAADDDYEDFGDDNDQDDDAQRRTHFLANFLLHNN